MRASLTGVLAFLACFAALQVVYPWATYYENFEFGWWQTMVSYLLVSALIGVGAAWATGLILGRSNQSAALRGIESGALTFGLAVLLAVLFGPAGLNIPGTRVRGIFFSEFNFLNFLFLVAAPLSLFISLFNGWQASRARSVRVDGNPGQQPLA